jgi:hypothetical protein
MNDLDETTSAPATEPGRTHPVNIGHLVMGLAFLSLVAVWGIIESGVVGLDDTRWLLPVPWLFAGAVGLVALLVANRRGRAR